MENYYVTPVQALQQGGFVKGFLSAFKTGNPVDEIKLPSMENREECRRETAMFEVKLERVIK